MLLIMITASLLTAPVKGQDADVDPYRFWKWPAEDAVALAGALSSEESVFLLGTSGLLFLTIRHDAELTHEFSKVGSHSRLLVRAVEEMGNVRSVRPFAGVLFLGSLLTDNQRFQDAAFTSLESVVLANLITSGLKTAFGRARPFQDKGAIDFRPFSGNTSFPSGHATTAFAFVTPWLMYYPNAFTPGLLILGAGTAFTRLITRNHWFSDVLAGSAIGFSTAFVLTRRHQDAEDRVQIAPSLGMDHIGMSVAFRMP